MAKLLTLLTTLILLQSCNSPRLGDGEPPYEGRKCEEAIDYDWDTGKFICPEDTIYMMKDPYSRGWIRKSDFKPRSKRKTLPLPKTREEELEELVDEHGLE
jgi:hypothetical protein